MSSCFQNINVPACVWFETEDRRNSYVSIIAGLLFFAGWWTIIDAATIYPGKIDAGYFFIGVAGTVALFMINSISNAQMRGDGYEGSCLGTRGARIWLFLGFVMGFASVIASCGILFTRYIKETPTYPGVALFLQNAMICISSVMYKFGRSEDLWG